MMPSLPSLPSLPNIGTLLRLDPYLNYRFLVEIEGLVVGGFTEVSGLQSELAFQDYEEGGQNQFIHRLPGRLKYPNLVLKHGLTDLESLWSWHRDIADGKLKRHNGSIILLNTNFIECWCWSFIGGYPIKWTGPQLNAGSVQVAFESIEIVHQGITKGISGLSLQSSPEAAVSMAGSIAL
jgi:phage tail-like protein